MDGGAHQRLRLSHLNPEQRPTQDRPCEFLLGRSPDRTGQSGCWFGLSLSTGALPARMRFT